MQKGFLVAQKEDPLFAAIYLFQEEDVLRVQEEHLRLVREGYFHPVQEVLNNIFSRYKRRIFFGEKEYELLFAHEENLPFAAIY